MSIDFSRERWEKIKCDYREWWAGRLERPLLHLTLTGYPPGRAAPAVPPQDFTSYYPLSVSAADVVDAWDYVLSSRRFLGDSFPSVWPNFGASVMAALLGARLVNCSETTWFFTSQNQAVEKLSFEYDPGNVWLNRILDIYRAGLERWEGQVLMGTTELGGNLDVLSTFRPGEKLLLDLYDRPHEVKRLSWRLHELWWKYFQTFNAYLHPLNPGYTCWTTFYSETPYAMLQCDFAYMIGPEMFDEFVKPELQASCRRLGNAFYHLDGPGQLRHLDSLLSIPELKGIQWVPGAGNPNCSHWPEIYRKIRDAGKLIHIFYGDFDSLEVVTKQLGGAKGVIFIAAAPAAREREVRDCLRRYRAL